MKITITGLPAEGKTTISLLIQEALARAGLPVHNRDVDVILGTGYRELQQRRVEALRSNDKFEIIIETVQIMRRPE